MRNRKMKTLLKDEPKSQERIEKLQNKMKRARLAYGLSCNDMSRICGFGINQWNLYEDGKSIPSGANKHLIRIATNPNGMLNLLNICPQFTKDVLGNRFYKCVSNVLKITDALREQVNNIHDHLADNYFSNKPLEELK